MKESKGVSEESHPKQNIVFELGTKLNYKDGLDKHWSTYHR